MIFFVFLLVHTKEENKRSVLTLRGSGNVMLSSLELKQTILLSELSVIRNDYLGTLF